MPRLVTATELVSRVKTACQLPTVASSKFVSDTELKTMIRESYAELYDLLVAARGVEYYRKTTTIGVAADTQELPLDATNAPKFYQLLEVLVARTATISEQVVERGTWLSVDAASDWVTLRPYQVHETAGLLNTTYTAPECLRYRLGGQQYVADTTDSYPILELLPAPTENVALKLIYLPIADVQTSAESPGDETYDGVNGWEEFIVCDVAARVLAIEESDNSYWVGRREQLRARVQGLAGARNAGQPERVVDRRSQRARDAGGITSDALDDWWWP